MVSTILFESLDYKRNFKNNNEYKIGLDYNLALYIGNEKKQKLHRSKKNVSYSLWIDFCTKQLISLPITVLYKQLNVITINVGHSKLSLK